MPGSQTLRLRIRISSGRGDHLQSPSRFGSRLQSFGGEQSVTRLAAARYSPTSRHARPASKIVPSSTPPSPRAPPQLEHLPLVGAGVSAEDQASDLARSRRCTDRSKRSRQCRRDMPSTPPPRLPRPPRSPREPLSHIEVSLRSARSPPIHPRALDLS
jgi:hypothetical protein